MGRGGRLWFSCGSTSLLRLAVVGYDPIHHHAMLAPFALGFAVGPESGVRVKVRVRVRV